MCLLWMPDDSHFALRSTKSISIRMKDQDSIKNETPKNDEKVIRAWALFDWANSAYSLVISTAIFPIYYIAVAPEKLNVFGTELSNSSVYSYSIAFAYIVVALIAPILGGIADAGSKRLSFLKIFTTVGSIACMILFFFSDAPMVWLGTAAFIVSTIGFAGSLIFYDAFLPTITTSDNYDAVSAKGYSYGYIGSVLLLITILFISQKPELFGIPSDSSLPYRIGFLLVGLWWIGWSQYTFRHLPKDVAGNVKNSLLSDGYREMRKVMWEIGQKPNLKKFLWSFFFYSAGVNTVIYLATVFADKELGFSSSELILTVLILQIVAIGGAIFFARYAKAKGSKKAIMIMIVIWFVICLVASVVTSKALFYALAFFVGLVLGGIQSSSRASYTKLIEFEEEYNSYFSFYDLLFYVSIVFGTFSFGLIDNLTNNLRYSVLILALFFVVAALIFKSVTIVHEAVPNREIEEG